MQSKHAILDFQIIYKILFHHLKLMLIEIILKNSSAL
jgi:hypothetical protein